MHPLYTYITYLRHHYPLQIDYNTAFTTTVNGSVSAVLRDGTEITASDNGHVLYRPSDLQRTDDIETKAKVNNLFIYLYTSKQPINTFKQQFNT